MDLGSINEKLLHTIQRAQIEQVTLISKTLGLKIGSQFLAQVQKINQATPAQREEIIKTIDATLAQLNKNSSAPATQALINQLTEQKKLLQEPAIKLASLNVTPQLMTGTATSTAMSSNPTLQNLLTYTNLPLQTGQTLLLQIAEGSRLQLLQPLSQTQVETLIRVLQTQGINISPPANTGNTNNPSNSTNLGLPLTKDLIAQIAKLNLSSLLSENTTTEQKSSINEQARTAISNSLRTLLPRKDSGQDLVSTLPKIAQFIQQLPIAQRKEWLPNQIQDALKTLANHIRLSEQLQNPKLLAMALTNNGQGFENKLAQLLSTATTQSQASTTATTGVTNTNTTAVNTASKSTPTAANKLLNPTNSLLTTSKSIPLLSNTNSSNNSTLNIDKIIAQDLKGSLLSLLHQLDTEISSAGASPLNPTDTTKNNLLNALPQLLGLLMSKQQGELNQKQLRTQLILLMHQYTLGSIAKIQLQQIHTVNQQLSQPDVAQPNQSWQFELPVRHGQDVHPLQIHIEQQWIEEQQESESPASTRVRQWNVMLNFDLPIVGKFYAQLGLLGDNLSAKFWAEQENTLAEAKTKMDELKQHLEQQGIKVTHMQCVPGLPPKPKMMLGYSLVDIKT
ncbi:flagellar hook-length control protein FliK [Cellvibrio sp. KY-GH-1]|uniref:flagellar hook-length control protein FliK n=1 Tax=Cellvibrio sp. KY-GH-1 TaxID=2303332 RepID=UPI0012461E3B|nr:flagellar hook-length control protein FliK [Cellvibrio sp. KY-GH-1]QEY15001.1 flagellar hook-length control protein FliK [Cellvibrio sp. KY-GH-1]